MMAAIQTSQCILPSEVPFLMSQLVSPTTQSLLRYRPKLCMPAVLYACCVACWNMSFLRTVAVAVTGLVVHVRCVACMKQQLQLFRLVKLAGVGLAAMA